MCSLPTCCSLEIVRPVPHPDKGAQNIEAARVLPKCERRLRAGTCFQLPFNHIKCPVTSGNFVC